VKTCTKCKIEKPKADFGKHKSKKDGLRCHCKQCLREYSALNSEVLCARQRAYRSSNPEQVAASAKLFRIKNPEKIASWTRAYSEASAERISKKCKAYYAENTEKITERSRAYYALNKDHCAARNKAYRSANATDCADRAKAYVLANPEKTAETKRNQRARKRNADGKHTAAEVTAIFQNQRGLCANCNTKLFTSGKQKYHVDHVMPLALGGSNDRYNLQCLCPACNQSKSAKHPDDWAKENGRLI